MELFYSGILCFPNRIKPIIFNHRFLFYIFFRSFVILQKPKKQIYIRNHLANFFSVCFLHLFFRNSKIDFKRSSQLVTLLCCTCISLIIHESMRVHKYAYIYTTFASILFYTVIAFSVEDFTGLPLPIKSSSHIYFYSLCIFGYFINKSRKRLFTIMQTYSMIKLQSTEIWQSGNVRTVQNLFSKDNFYQRIKV